MPLQNKLFIDAEKELKYKKFNIINESIKENINSKIKKWKKITLDYLKNQIPLQNHYLSLIKAERDYKHYGGEKETILKDLINYKKLIHDLTDTFWINKREELLNKKNIQEPYKKSDDKKIKEIDDLIRRNIQESWRKDFEKKKIEWELKEIKKLRSEFLKELFEWLEKIQALKNIFDELGLMNGILWDLSLENLSSQDISELKNWSEFLKNDKNIKRLCELMGKFNKEIEKHNYKMIARTKNYITSIPDTHSNEEIVGIKLGRDLANILPQELSLLSDSDISILFDLKFVENRLMCFEKQGNTELQLEKTTKEKVSENKKGPIIICVDTSGSMIGAPETIAKALTLVLSSQASSEKRNCYLINFSTNIETLDLIPPKGIKELIGFLQMSFHGGTDITPALKEGIKMMQDNNYTKADLLIISDFIFPNKSIELNELIGKQKKNKNRFFSLSIGDFKLFERNKLFNEEWVYNPKTGTIEELNNISEWIRK